MTKYQTLRKKSQDSDESISVWQNSKGKDYLSKRFIKLTRDDGRLISSESNTNY